MTISLSSTGTCIFVLIVLYCLIKNAVKNGIKEAYEDIMGSKIPSEDSDDAYTEK